MLLVIRRHNNLVAGAAASQQLSAVLRREKKVAFDMALISLVLLLSLVPVPLNKTKILLHFATLDCNYGFSDPFLKPFLVHAEKQSA